MFAGLGMLTGSSYRWVPPPAPLYSFNRCAMKSLPAEPFPQPPTVNDLPWICRFTAHHMRGVCTPPRMPNVLSTEPDLVNRTTFANGRQKLAQQRIHEPLVMIFPSLCTATACE